MRMAFFVKIWMTPVGGAPLYHLDPRDGVGIQLSQCSFGISLNAHAVCVHEWLLRCPVLTNPADSLQRRLLSYFCR